MENTEKNIFYRRAIRVGNSSGILLPKKLLGSDVKVEILNHAPNVKKDIFIILEPILEDILGVYLISKDKEKFELLAVSNKVNRHMEQKKYSIDIVPLQVLKKSLKNKSKTKENIKKAEVILNKKLLAELRNI